ncbi:MAG: PEP-CTERM sorting domain-containing protein [Bryobacteraceae bacterium]|nr:PEP-CTERM sorting domain-containing protein [Bryobacteraceae bacterium]
MKYKALTLTLAACVTASAAPIQWTVASGGNGNWYEHVPAISIFSPIPSFAAAEAAATASSFMGMPGYLATITSAEENAFIRSSFTFLIFFGGVGNVFLGGSDEAEEGVFRWTGGPEKGQKLSYTNWFPGHPVASGTYIRMGIFPGSPSDGNWDVIPPSGGSGGYIIEYGSGVSGASPVPEPATAAGVALALTALGLWRRRPV